LLTDDLAAIVENDLVQAAGQTQSAQLIFPSVRSADQVANLVKRLCHGGRMFCEDASEPDGDLEVLQLGLGFCLPDERHFSRVMGMANLDTMPLTRRAPVTALVLRLGPPGRSIDVMRGKPLDRKPSDRGRSTGLIAVNLADLPSDLDDDTIRLYAATTEQQVSEKLKEDIRAEGARLKISFSLPVSCRDAVASALADG